MTDADSTVDTQLHEWSRDERAWHQSAGRPIHPTLFAHPAPGRRRRRRALFGFGAAAVVLLGGGTAIAVGVLGSEPVTDYSTARCYVKASKDFGPDFHGTTVASPIGSDGSGGRIVAPIQACAESWRVGYMQGILPPKARPPYPVPHLVGCVLPDGTAAVFPGPEGTCHRLGLPDALPG